MSFKTCLFSIVESKNDIREYLGISYMKSYLEEKGTQCSSRVIYKDEIEETLAELKEFPKLIGISAYCDTLNLVKYFCNRAKELSTWSKAARVHDGEVPTRFWQLSK